ncbi:MAG TPA: MFS transporter [Dehalococcoidales bacterium]|nr:MFS transporter [Dehalococcoidales bacterium]
MLAYGIITGAERACMPVLFKQISLDLNLSIVNLGTIWGLDPLAGIFVGLPGGLLVDRLGIKRTMVVVCFLAGIFSALRGFSTNFATMAGSTFLFGMMAAMAPAIVPKTTTVWFKKEQLGLTNSLIFIASSVFAMAATLTSATVLSPWLGGWQNVLFLLGAPAILLSLIWWITARDPDKRDREIGATVQVPFREALSVVMRNKEVWVLALITFLVWASWMGLSGYLPLYLRNIGWKPIQADSAVTAVNGAVLAGSIPMVLAAGRFGYKKMLFISVAGSVLGMGLMPVVHGGAIWVLLIVSSFLRSGASALTNVLIFEAPGIGGKYAGTAMGLVSSVGMGGAFFSPPVGNSFADAGAAMPFLFWAGLALLSLPMFILLRKSKNAAEIKAGF